MRVRLKLKQWQHSHLDKLLEWSVTPRLTLTTFPWSEFVLIRVRKMFSFLFSSLIFIGKMWRELIENWILFVLGCWVEQFLLFRQLNFEFYLKWKIYQIILKLKKYCFFLPENPLSGIQIFSFCCRIFLKLAHKTWKRGQLKERGRLLLRVGAPGNNLSLWKWEVTWITLF